LQSFQINGIDIEIIFALNKTFAFNKSKSNQLTKRPSSGKLLTWFWLLLIIAFYFNDVSAKTVYVLPQAVADSVISVRDTVVIDTVIEKKSHTTIDAKIERTARDSIVQDVINKKVLLYGDAEIKYQDIDLQAATIEIDFNNNTVTAYGVVDTTGKLLGRPVFKQGDQTFKADTIEYNITTGKGYIYSIYTEDNQGYLAGEKVKKLPDNSINLLYGSYTTCNIEHHPHFRFKFKKARVIPDNKIVTGPAYMEIEGIPTPLALPFGMFPNNSRQRSGIVIPSPGESANRGFYLEGGGYYWAINDYMDLKVIGDIYSRGSWAIKPTFRYKKRYKFSGSFAAQYAVNIISDKYSPDYQKSNDFRIRWTHSQDTKARPNSRFNANVNIVTSNFIKYNSVDVNDYLSNEFQSSVSYQTSFAGKYYLTVNGSHRQNTKTHVVQITLPEVTFNVNRFYPLRKKKRSGKKRFYEDLSVTYSMNGKNIVNTFDSLVFTEQAYQRDMQNGIVHKMPVNLPIKLFKYFTWSNSINATDRMYAQHVDQYWSNDTLIEGNDTLVGYVAKDTVTGFNNAFDFRISSSLSTKAYGMLRFKKGPLRAIRHVFTPSVSFNYVPDFGSSTWGYYDSYIDGDGEEVVYSKYQGALYGSPPGRKSGQVGFNFGNNLEIKVRSRKDTVTGMKKITLIKSFNISGNYDLAKDSINMSFLSLSGRTTIWKNIDLKYSSLWDPYVLDSAGRQTNTFEWTQNRRLFRKANTTWALSLSLRLSDKDFKKKEDKNEEKEKKNKDKYVREDVGTINDNSEYIDWNIPWSINLSYNFNYTTHIAYLNYEKIPTNKIVQTLGFSGQVNITPKWKVTFRSGWDFTSNKVSLTSFSIYRDLHCWEMRFNVIPFGPRKSWNFSINVKASILQDLKLNKKKDFRDF
jgi:lipopolysaccharide assembly outer membrane protein LptD (OstA)